MDERTYQITGLLTIPLTEPDALKELLRLCPVPVEVGQVDEHGAVEIGGRTFELGTDYFSSFFMIDPAAMTRLQAKLFLKDCRQSRSKHVKQLGRDYKSRFDLAVLSDSIEREVDEKMRGNDRAPPR